MTSELRSWPSKTKEYEVPGEDVTVSVFVTLLLGADDCVERVLVWAGKSGEISYATGEALASVVGVALRDGVSPRKLYIGLLGQHHTDSRVFGLTAASVPDALGRMLRDHYEEREQAYYLEQKSLSEEPSGGAP